NLNLLELKLLLIRKKKEGFIFFTESMSSILIDQSFIICLSQKRLPGQYNDAFPVSRSQTKTKPSFDELKNIYKEYHQVKEVPLNIDFSSFSIYKAEKWFWFWNEKEI
ncbi:hypothetical protein V7659_29430, partial [Neobacillus drentensis]|uniref:hypothetical protein n=1 Tax=Neobacillus drentensis TaxID=220684 RepID=UPI002FFF3B1A